MKKTLEVMTGSLEDMGRDFVAAWHAAERGKLKKSKTAIYFADMMEMFSVLTPTRLALLRELAKHQSMTTHALAKELERDYKNVHTDVALLERHGFIERERRGLRVPFDEIHAGFVMRKAA
jgi:predicted transcriptional regulator